MRHHRPSSRGIGHRRIAPLLLVALLSLSACDNDASTTRTTGKASFAEDLENICATGGNTPGGPAAIVPVMQDRLAVLDPDAADDRATLAELVDIFDAAKLALEAGRVDEAGAHIEDASAVVRKRGLDCGEAKPQPADLTQPDSVIDIGGAIGQVTAAGNDVWVADFDKAVVTRVHSSTGQILARITVEDAELRTIQVTANGVWVRGASALHRIDPASNRVIATVIKGLIGTDITRVFVDDTAMWACSGTTIIRANLQGAPTSTASLGFPCGTVSSAAGQVWVTSDDGAGRLAKIDPRTAKVLLTTDIPIDHATFPSIEGSTVWTHSQAHADKFGFVAVDATTGKLLFHSPMDAGGGPGALTETTYYAAASDVGQVLVVDRTTGTVLARLDGGTTPNATTFNNGHLWVVDDTSGQLRRFDV